MGRKEAVVAQPISLTWLCMDRVERTGPRQVPSVPYRILEWYPSLPSYKGQRSALVENRHVGLWGIYEFGITLTVRPSTARFNNARRRLQIQYIQYDARFRGSVPLAIFVSLLDEVIGCFLSTLRAL